MSLLIFILIFAVFILIISVVAITLFLSKKQQSTLGDEVKKLQIDLDSLKSNNEELLRNLSLSREDFKSVKDTTDKLNSVLSNNQQRGYLGERMAETLLQHFGLKEGIHYTKKPTEGNKQPDLCFNLPNEKRLNLDVKFPYASYKAFHESDSKFEKEKLLKEFIKDVKDHIKSISEKGYINVAEGTLDICLIYIPAETIYNFINQHDDIMKLAEEKNIILCSPNCLFGIFSIMHQASQNLLINQKAKVFQSELIKFREQWLAYKSSMDKIGDKIDEAKKQFETTQTTRVNQLERPLNKAIDHKFKEDE